MGSLWLYVTNLHSSHGNTAERLNNYNSLTVGPRTAVAVNIISYTYYNSLTVGPWTAVAVNIISYTLYNSLTV